MMEKYSSEPHLTLWTCSNHSLCFCIICVVSPLSLPPAITVTLTKHGGKEFKSKKRDCLSWTSLLIICRRSAHLWEVTRLPTSHNRMSMAASSSTSPLSVSYTPSCPNLLHKQPRLVWPGLSIPEPHEVFFSDFISVDCPQRNCLWVISARITESLCVRNAVCVCVLLTRGLPCSAPAVVPQH